MSSFFTAPASQRKRKRPEAAQSSAKRRNTSAADQRSSNRKRHRSESISGSESDSEDGAQEEALSGQEEASEDENETAAEKRLRLAEQYLENIRAEVDEVGFDAAELDRDLIAERLKEDVAESKGKVYRHLADELDFEGARRMFFRADQMDITAVASCAPYVYTAAKDRSIVKWELPSQAAEESQTGPRESDAADGKSPRKPKFTASSRPKKLAFARGRSSSNKAYLGHTSSILCAAASTTGRFLATGGLDRRIVIWDVSAPEQLAPVKVFAQHRDIVTGLAFRRGTNQLYSCSRDRTVKVWSLNELAYVETLFGHQDAVADIAAGAKEVCISVGARDRTARLWKVGEETQLVFRGGGLHGAKGKFKDKQADGAADRGMREWERLDPELLHAEGSIDRIALVDDDTFVTGSDNGALCLWSVHKKKPVAVIPLAHGLNPPMRLEDSFAEAKQGPEREGRVPAPPSPRWITALASIPYSDVFVSASWDGTVKAWKIRRDRRGMEAIGVVSPLPEDDEDAQHVNGALSGHSAGSKKRIDGVITDLTIVERGDRAREGIAVVAVTGRAHRLGRWMCEKARSTAVKFDVDRRRLTNGANGHAENGDGGGDSA